ncbi:type II toxin-antitoxin system HipA family toxin [Bordetella muralis]|uniref:type II toxin-antitoxin system HipA family toxin n=1 Tax=Bordetella muralis TaxID=1649130 RepID=UPI0039F0BA81
MATVDALDVYAAGRCVGRLFDEQPLRFRYDPAWLTWSEARPIAPSLGLGQQDHVGDHVLAYFENLLPEGHIRRFLSVSRHASTAFGLLRSVGGDTASGLTIVPQGEKPAPPGYRPTTWVDIAQQLQHAVIPALAAENAEGTRISLAGAQDKLLLMVLPDGVPAIPQGTAPSSHILKPDIRGLDGVWSSALNEAMVMKLASALGLQAAEVEYQPDTRACLVRRYDRRADGAGGLARLHQLDLCQLAGTPSAVKYESDGGPTLAQCREILRRMGVKAQDMQRFVRWVFFNLFVGNNDSHAKNLSVMQDTGDAWRMTPFYDLMCTAIYPGLSRRFAFRIGGEALPGKIGVEQLQGLSQDLGFSDRYVLRAGRELAEQLPAALGQVAAELRNQTRPGTEHTLLERLEQWIRSNTRKHVARWELR